MTPVRHFGGKAAYIAFTAHLGWPNDWESLQKDVQEAWIAAAHEACMLRYIIENYGKDDGPKSTG